MLFSLQYKRRISSKKKSIKEEGHTSFKKHTARFAWHIERISTDEGMSSATCKACSYCDKASSYFPSTKSLLPSNFASFASLNAFCYKKSLHSITFHIIKKDYQIKSKIRKRLPNY